MRKVCLVASFALLAGCGSPADRPTPPRDVVQPTASPTPHEADPGPLPGPGSFRLTYAAGELRLPPYTFCFSHGCVDGIDPSPQTVPGNTDEIRVEVPITDWRLIATFVQHGSRCGRHQTVEPVSAADGSFILRPVGHAGRYDVDLFASGPGGDMVATFAWVTPVDGELATPTARLAVIADHDGRPDSYGIELAVDNLAETPDRSSAHLTVTAANGKALDFDAVPSGQRCLPEGSIYFDGPDAAGKRAAALGPAPFTYEVALVLDGTVHRATASYPEDVIDGNEPSVALSFSPALPAPR